MEKLLREKLKDGKFQDVLPEHSKRMSAVKGRGNKTTELRLRFALVRSGIKGWVVHPRGITGNPDFYFPSCKLAVFVDGCFWHGCIKCGHIPKKNNAFWATKIHRNQERDAEKTHQLLAQGFYVLRFWEHEVQHNISNCISRVKELMY